jgi:hypothetical protein
MPPGGTVRPSPPPFPIFKQERWASLKFTSFHNGMDSTMPIEERDVDENHQILPTTFEKVQHWHDREEPDAFEFISPYANTALLAHPRDPIE